MILWNNNKSGLNKFKYCEALAHFSKTSFPNSTVEKETDEWQPATRQEGKANNISSTLLLHHHPFLLCTVIIMKSFILPFFHHITFPFFFLNFGHCFSPSSNKNNGGEVLHYQIQKDNHILSPPSPIKSLGKFLRFFYFNLNKVLISFY